MTDEQAVELRRLAEAATKGPWSTKEYGPDHVEVLLPNGFSRIISDPTVVTDYDARFIAAANPATVLDLLNELAALKPRPVRESYSCKVCGRRLLDAIPCEDHPMMPVVSSLPDAATLTAWLDHEQQESKALATALPTANERWARAEKERDALKAEVARLRFELTGEDEE